MTRLGIPSLHPIGIGKLGCSVTADSHFTYQTVRLRGIAIRFVMAYLKDTIGCAGPSVRLAGRISQVISHNTAEATVLMGSN